MQPLIYSNVFLIVFVTLAAAIDITTRRIPNKLILASLITAIALRVGQADSDVVLEGVLGMLLGFGIMLPFYLVRGMAAGDVKMMAVVGAFVGPGLIFKTALVTFLLGGTGAICIVLFSGKARAALVNIHLIFVDGFLRFNKSASGLRNEKNTEITSVGRMPYGPAIALATVLVAYGL